MRCFDCPHRAAVLSQGFAGKPRFRRDPSRVRRSRYVSRQNPPGEDGLSLCRHIREAYDTPIHLLTALAEGTDRIVGLEIGADDDVLAAEVRIVP